MSLRCSALYSEHPLTSHIHQPPPSPPPPPPPPSLTSPLLLLQYVIATSIVVITVTAVTSTLRSTSFSSLLIFPPSATVEEERGGHRRGGYLRVLRPENRVAQTLLYFDSRHALAVGIAVKHRANFRDRLYEHLPVEWKRKGWLIGVISLFFVISPSLSENVRLTSAGEVDTRVGRTSGGELVQQPQVVNGNCGRIYPCIRAARTFRFLRVILWFVIETSGNTRKLFSSHRTVARGRRWSSGSAWLTRGWIGRSRCKWTLTMLIHILCKF